MAHLSERRRGQGKKLAALAGAVAASQSKAEPDAQARNANPLLAAIFRSSSDAAATGESHYLWPCNVGLWALWQDLQTQWRTGMGGATGLDYAGVRAYLEDAPVDGHSRAEVWAAVRACERATLQAWAKGRGD